MPTGFSIAMLAATLVIVAAASAPRAQDVLRIAAVVNDRVISALDVVNRMKLVMFTTGLQNTPENRRRLSPQVMRNLIDEELKTQEAARLNIKVSEREVDKDLRKVEKLNKMPPGGLPALLKSEGIAVSTLRAQLRTQIAWGRTIGRKLRRETRVSDDEVDDELKRIVRLRNQPQYRVAELFLSVDDPDQEEQVRLAALRIKEQIRGGANFAALARAFSQSTTAAVGGDLGWIQTGRLPQELDKAVQTLEPGQLAGPIRTLAGYYLLLLRDRRQPEGQNADDAVVDLRQIVIPLDPNSTEAELAAQKNVARTLRGTLSSCADLAGAAKAIGTKESGSLGKIRIRDLPKSLRTAVRNLKVGEPSAPVLSPSGRLLILMVCERVEPKVKLPSRSAVRRRLRAQRIELLARRYLRDLRRAAFIDLRG